jgi:hypothetical protein
MGLLIVSWGPRSQNAPSHSIPQRSDEPWGKKAQDRTLRSAPDQFADQREVLFEEVTTGGECRDGWGISPLTDRVSGRCPGRASYLAFFGGNAAISDSKRDSRVRTYCNVSVDMLLTLYLARLDWV